MCAAWASLCTIRLIFTCLKFESRMFGAKLPRSVNSCLRWLPPHFGLQHKQMCTDRIRQTRKTDKCGIHVCGRHTTRRLVCNEVEKIVIRHRFREPCTQNHCNSGIFHKAFRFKYTETGSSFTTPTPPIIWRSNIVYASPTKQSQLGIFCVDIRCRRMASQMQLC